MCVFICRVCEPVNSAFDNRKCVISLKKERVGGPSISAQYSSRSMHILADAG